ncbi:unnamed protein product [Phytophthora fragariaefolia]|uniref:Unnamed protein product n=1 Tax=Phytophthora fragariaefolia TaxID=1490495 RepID=A0A9W6XG63_9STRA|nr:unnamed protein product [Phytophthora fragariaefolia]
MGGEQDDEDRVPLLTSVSVVCREVPGVAVERRVLKRIEKFLDHSQRCWFDSACGQSLSLAKRVLARTGWSRDVAVNGLCHAGLAGRVDVIQWLCAVGESVGTVRTSELVTLQSFWSGSLTSIAASTGKTLLMQWLLEKGAPVNVKDGQGSTLLHTAGTRGHSSMVQLLLQNGANVNERNDKGQTPLHLASSVAMGKPSGLELLASANNTNGNRQTIPDTLERQVSIVQMLLDNGARANVKDCKGQTALHLASSAWMRDASIVELLLNRGARAFDLDDAGHIALHYAIVNSHFKAVEFFLTKCCNDELLPVKDLWNALFAAARGNHDGIIKHLVQELHVDVSVTNRRGRTALLEAVAACTFDSVGALLDQGADVNRADRFGVTPVMEACRQCDFDTLHVLLQHGGSVRDVDLAGRTAMHYAAEGSQRCDHYSVFNRD